MRAARRVAKAAAEKLLTRYAVERAEHILLDEIADDLGVEVVAGPLKGAVARLVRSKDRARIRVSESVKHRGRRRFCVAHELGHHLMDSDDGRWVRCLEEDLEEFGDRRLVEARANLFAAEFLLPDRLLRKQCDVARVNLSVPRTIASDFEVSLTAAAIRFTDLCPEACALVYSVDAAVSWVKRNEGFRGWLLGRGSRLVAGSVASDLAQRRVVEDRAVEVAARVWLPDETKRSREIVEHSVRLESQNAVLTLLWIPVDDEDEEEEESELVESWTPRFRR